MRWPAAGPGDLRSSLEIAAADAGVRDPRVLSAIRAVPRSAFLPEGLRARAVLDAPLPIGYGQTTSEPSLIALMIETLRIEPGDSVLEIGTGFGYQTALLAVLARLVRSVDRIPELARAAAENLAIAGLRNVEVYAGDGTLGLPSHAPFDAIVVSAAFPVVPAALADQLASGRRLVQPVGRGGDEIVTVFEKRGGAVVPLRDLCAARFVPLISEQRPGP